MGYSGITHTFPNITHTFPDITHTFRDFNSNYGISYIGYILYIIHTLYYTLHTEHAYCLSYRFLNNVVITTVIEMVEMVEILDGRLGKGSVERVRYVINNLLHLVIVKYGDIPLVLCISTHLWLVTILSLLAKYLVILHADPCNKSYILYGHHNRSLYPACAVRAG